MGCRVLIVDDESDFLDAMGDYLALRGLDVATAASAASARTALAAGGFDAVILDLRIGSDNGIELARWIGESSREGEQPALILVSGFAGPAERIVALELGADDFLEKPVVPRELLARLRILLRACGRQPRRSHLLSFDGAAIDMEAQTLVRPDGAEVPFTASEFALLKCFLDEPGKVFGRDELLERAPASDADAMDRAIDRRVARLRAKLAAEIGGDGLIETVRGHGYRMPVPTTSSGPRRNN